MAKSDDNTISVFNWEGVNQKVSPFLADRNNLHKGINVIHSQIGLLESRLGYVTFLDAPDAASVRNIIPFILNNGTTKRILRVSGASVYSYAYSGSTWGAAVKTLADTTIPLGSVFFADQNKLILGNGVDTSFSYDGTTFANITAAPKSPYICVYQNRIAMRDDANLFRVKLSKTGDHTNWTETASDSSSAQHFDVDGTIRGLTVIADKVTVFHSKGIARIHYDGNSWQRVEIPTSAVLSSYALTVNETVWLYGNKNGIYHYAGAQLPKLISRAIDEIYKNGANVTAASTTAAAAKDKVYFSLGSTTDIDGDTIANALAVYSFLDNYFEIHSLANAITALAVDDGTLLMGDSAGNTWTWSSGVLDNATTINGIVETVPLIVSEQLIEFGELFVFSDGAPIDVGYQLTGGEWKTLGTTYDKVSRFVFAADDIGNWIKLRFTGGSPFKLYGIKLKPKTTHRGEI